MKKILTFCLIALTLTGCAKHVPEQNNFVKTELSNPIVDYKNLEELSKAGGVDLSKIEMITEILKQAEGNDIQYQLIGDIEQIVITYENGSQSTIRVSDKLYGPTELGGYHFTNLENVENTHIVVDNIEINCGMVDKIHYCITNEVAGEIASPMEA